MRHPALSWLIWVAMALVSVPVAAQDKRTLVVGSEQDYPPFAVGMTDATAGGFTVELWQEVAREQKLAHTLRVRPFDELLHALKAGEIDVLLNLAKSDERRTFADFSATHVVVSGAVFVRKGDTRIRAEDDLAGKSIIVLRGDLAHDYATAKGWAPRLVLADTTEHGLRLLASGQHDAMLVSKLAGMQTLRSRGIGNVAPLDVKVGFSQRFAFAVRKGDTELLTRINEGLALAKTDGEYDRLYDKWFAPYEANEPGWREARPVLAGAALFALIAWAITFRNRRRRDQRNAAILRESEALLAAKSHTLEATLERMEQGVMMVTADRIVEVCNRKAIELLDLPPELMASKPTFTQVLEFQWSTDEFADTPESLRQFVRAGGILDQPQCYERKRPNGRVMEIRSIPIEGGGVLRTYTDITQRKQAEATRLALEAQLLEAKKLEAIGTLAGGIAHDFNNIMAAILGNAALARIDVGEGHPAQRFLDQIGIAGQRARSLVQQILTFSRQQPNEFVSVALQPLIEETVTMLRSMTGPTVQLRCVLPSAKLAVMGNPTQLQQVLMNLGTNAWHALGDGAGQIEIGLEACDFSEGQAPPQSLQSLQSPPAGLAPGAYARLWVRDDGCGMSDETRQRIYEPFFTTKPVGRGTGLGLAVVHGIVKTLAGAIEVTSALGQGSTFEVYLPLVEHESRPMPLDAAELHGARDAQGKGQHVLYVDDDEVMAVMVQGLLQRLGYRATYMLEADAAIESIEREPGNFDLVVTDFNMPNVSGLDLVRALARVRPDLPVVISSGYVSDELRANASVLGVCAVMQKEQTLEELGAVVHSALEASPVVQWRAQ